MGLYEYMLLAEVLGAQAIWVSPVVSRAGMYAEQPCCHPDAKYECLHDDIFVYCHALDLTGVELYMKLHRAADNQILQSIKL